jgi:hypothetical protein
MRPGLRGGPSFRPYVASKLFEAPGQPDPALRTSACGPGHAPENRIGEKRLPRLRWVGTKPHKPSDLRQLRRRSRVGGHCHGSERRINGLTSPQCRSQ